MESWKPVTGFEGLYEVSSEGNVRRIAAGGPSKVGVNRIPAKDADGYLRLGLSRNSVITTVKIHRVVAEAFFGPIHKLMTVNHRNGVKSDNRIENLEVVTRGENIEHAFRVIKTKSVVGESNPRATLTEEQVLEIRRRLALGEGGSALARAFGTNKYVVSDIKRGRSWSHLK